MNVLLINPPTSFEQIYGDWDLAALDTYTPPLGILHIASILRERNHRPQILDLQCRNWDLDKTVRHVLSLKPDIVGFSAMTINSLNASQIALGLKKSGLTSPLVLGGAHVSAVPVETLARFEAIDYGVVGEGEMTFLELVEKLEARQPIEDVRGIVRRNHEGRVIMNEPRPLIDNLDALPLPAWDLLDNFPQGYPSSLLESKRLPSAAIMTSRGCPFSCTFCDHRVFGSRVRHFSADYSLNLIRHLINTYGIRDLMILDDNFLLHKKKLFDICNAMIAERMDLTWYCIGHAKSMTAETLAKIKEAGCWFVEVGIESGNDQILRQIKKSADKAEIREAVRRARAAGLRTKGNFIFGFPGETKETLEETIGFALDLDLDFFQQNFLTVWPGCELSAEVSSKALNAEFYEPDWSKLAHQRITFVPAGMTQQELILASKKAFRKFYLRPRIVAGLAPRLASLRGLKFGLAAFYVFLRTIFRRPLPAPPGAKKAIP